MRKLYCVGCSRPYTEVHGSASVAAMLEELGFVRDVKYEGQYPVWLNLHTIGWAEMRGPRTMCGK